MCHVGIQWQQQSFYSYSAKDFISAGGVSNYSLQLSGSDPTFSDPLVPLPIA